MIHQPKVKLKERINELYIYIYMRWVQITSFLYHQFKIDPKSKNTL